MNLNGDRTDIKGNEWPYNLLEQVGFEDDDPLDHMSTEGELWLAMCMSRMTERERQIVRIRYFEQKTLKETGTRRSRCMQFSAYQKKMALKDWM